MISLYQGAIGRILPIPLIGEVEAIAITSYFAFRVPAASSSAAHRIPDGNRRTCGMAGI